MMIARRTPKNKPPVRKNARRAARQRASTKRRRASQRAALARRRGRGRGVDEGTLRRVATAMFEKLLHHKQILSVALVALGVVYAAKMTIHGIGTAMAKARGEAMPKHGIKQVDRYMSNDKIKPRLLREGLVRAAVGSRRKIIVTMDWTDHDGDDQTTLAISLLLRKKGRAIPLVWTTVRKSGLKHKRGLHEKTALQMLRAALPEGVRAVVLADRGFGDTETYDHLLGIEGFDFIIRFRGNIFVEAGDVRDKAQTLVPRNGRVRLLEGARLTAKRRGPYTVVLYKARGMKDSWHLATSLPTENGRDIVDTYARRFECEEGFRDLKDWRFGMALNYTRIGTAVRRERLLTAFAIAAFLLTLVGAACERLHFDRQLRANTSTRRTHSLFRQGREIVTGALPTASEILCLRVFKNLLSVALREGFCNAIR